MVTSPHSFSAILFKKELCHYVRAATGSRKAVASNVESQLQADRHLLDDQFEYETETEFLQHAVFTKDVTSLAETVIAH